MIFLNWGRSVFWGKVGKIHCKLRTPPHLHHCHPGWGLASESHQRWFWWHRQGLEWEVVLKQGVPFTPRPTKLASVALATEQHVTAQIGPACVVTELISAAQGIPVAAWSVRCSLLLCLLFVSTNSQNLLHGLLHLIQRRGVFNHCTRFVHLNCLPFQGLC